MEREKDYNKILIRFFEKTANDEELTQLSEWLKVSEENLRCFDEYNESYQLADITAKSWLYNVENNYKELKSRIQNEDRKPIVRMISNRQLMWWRSVAVVALLLAFTFSGLLFWGDQSLPYESQVVQVITPRGEKSEIILPDGTIVWLNSGSKLEYVYDPYAKRRIASLKGEGFFDVAKNEEIPFIVNTDQLEVKVYGTRFNVCAYDDDNVVETTLEEGSIGLLVKGTGEHLLITPGQQVKYDKISNQMALTEVKTDLFTSWKEHKLKFDNASFTEVVKKMERWYDVDIELDQQLNYSQRYTMTIKTESLREVLELIQFTTPVNYKINEDEVMIYVK
ncbi:MAG: DUF4974 domain-containing protein [Marinilabiliaceae bacterium]|nr:DUF4974 domain-containing protein [Marinilabiliaceae bacterium]